MSRKNDVFCIGLILFMAVCIFAGCKQSVTPEGDTVRDGTFDMDSLLIEVWANTSPPTFLGYDTGMTDRLLGGDSPIILTSTGYCVMIRDPSMLPKKKSYGDIGSYKSQSVSTVVFDDWGSMILFATASNPTLNDTPYLYAGKNNRWIENYVFYNPHDGGTYYTWAGTRNEQKKINFPAGFKLFDADGTLCTCNDATVASIDINGYVIEENFLFLVGNTDYLVQPLKKIGDYKELGLPNPDVLTYGIFYKVKK